MLFCEVWLLREVRKKSVVPIYGFALVWLIYCLFFPLYKPSHFLIVIIISVVATVVLAKVFPGKVEYIEEPVTTGDPEVDELLREGDLAIAEMRRLHESIKSESIGAKIDIIIEITGKIFLDVVDDRSDYRQIKRFADYYLPTTIKLLNAYDRMSEIGEHGENISGTLSRIDNILDTTIDAYRKQLDALFANQALDIETDITVLESMLKKEGLSGKDF